ncbi:MAG: class I SAM-dependent methyltransferase [Pseudomonadota bacterium]
MGTVALDDVDFSMFTLDDFANLVLQRSAVLGDHPGAARPIKAWRNGNPKPLRDLVSRDPVSLARSALGFINAEFMALRGLIERLGPKRVADIGCGYAIFDLCMYAATGADILLIDIEATDDRHFGYASEGAGYSSLAVAQRFLTANGVPESSISLWNPKKSELESDAPIDLAYSFLSCGFHYPIDMYLPFFRFAVKARGAVILDLRSRQANANISQLESLGTVRVLEREGSVTRVLLNKKPTAS